MDIEAIKNDYYSNMLIEDICKKYKITKYQLTYMRKKQGWKTRKHKGTKNNKGNKKAHGTIGNKNAVKTGAFEKISKDNFSEEELALFNEPLPDKKQILEDEIKMLTIRESRLLTKINDLRNKKQDLIIMSMSKYGTTTSTQAENVQILINRVEDGLTKVSEAKRRAIDSLHKIDIENRKFDYETNKDNSNQEELDKLDEVLKQIGGVI